MAKRDRSRSVPPASSPISGKPRQAALPPATRDADKLRFTFGELDHDGRWPLHKISAADLKRLLKRIQYFEGLTTEQAYGNKIISAIDAGSGGVSKRAQSRLADRYDGLDTFHEIRVEPSGAGRLHGRLEGRFFSIFWWDPNHEVCPEGKTVR